MVALASQQGRAVLVAMILGSAVVGLDATVVNLALPAIGREFGAGIATLQWVITAYLLTLAALILIGGSLGDRYGRRRVFLIGVAAFAFTSALSALAPNAPVLVVARALQGVSGALMTPGSLAIIEATFIPEDRSRAIGAWSAFAGITTAVGPLVGGYLIEATSWRWVFLLNLPLSLVVVRLTLRHVPETSDPSAPAGLDLAGGSLAVVGLGALTFGLVEIRSLGSGTGAAVVTVGTVALVAFVIIERRSRHPMLPVEIFRSPQFTGANLVTFVVYAGLGGMFFLLGVYLQTAMRYTPIEAGLAMLPVTVLMLLLSERAGALAARIGPRVPMTVGPGIVAGGLLLMARIVPGKSYAAVVLPAAVVFGLGLSLTVAPLTAAVLSAAETRYAGIASGVNNAVARTAQLLAVAVLPVIAGVSDEDYRIPAAFADSFRNAAFITAALAIAGGALAWLTIGREREVRPTAPPVVATEGQFHCGADAPPLRTR